MARQSDFRKVIKNEYEFTGMKLHYDYRLFILDILPKKSVGAEIGVYIGKFAEHIINVVRPSELFLIDPWTHKSLYFSFLQTYIHSLIKSETKIKIVKNTVEDSYKDKTIEDRYFDWVYLDTDHQLESTRRQLKICQKIVKLGGLICGDDYNSDYWPDVITAVDEFVEVNGMKLETKNTQYWIKNE